LGRSKHSRQGKPPGVREIADALGISIGTVDRALHDRVGISPETRARVLDMARSLGYRPNLAARFLSSEKRLRIGANLPRELASFWDLVREGLADAARAFEPSGVEIVLRLCPRLGEGEQEALTEALADNLDGLILAPGFPRKLLPLLERAAASKLPVVCVNTDAAGERLATVSTDPVTCGSMVGELMGRFLGGSGRVMLVTGQMTTMDHANKLRGFRRSVRTVWPRVETVAVVEGHDDEGEAYAKCREVLARTPDISGVYVSTANSPPVLRALQDTGLLGRVTLVTTDLFPALVPHLESGAIAATIDQRPWVQGQMAFNTIYRYLTEGLTPPSYVRLAPHVVMRSNLRLFLERLRSTTEGGTEPAAPVSLAEATPA
jgi:LacI family transcriptional regulator, galactose operon repressor